MDDTSTWIAFIALAVSILSPLVTAFINSCFSLKTHNDDFFRKPAAEIIENYLKSAGAAIVYPLSKEIFATYAQCFGEVFLYVSKKSWCDIEELNEKILAIQNGMRSSEAKSKAFELLSCISQDISKENPRKVFSIRNIINEKKKKAKSKQQKR